MKSAIGTSRKIFELIIVTAVSFLIICLSFGVGFATHNIVSVWPVAAVSYWAVRRHGASAMIAIFVADALRSFLFLDAPSIFYIPAVGNAVAAWMGVKIERQISKSDDIFQDTRSALAFLLAGLGTLSIASAIIGVCVLSIHFHLSPAQAIPLFWRWSLSDYSGCLILAPLLFYIMKLPASFDNKRETTIDGAICLTAIVLVWAFNHSSMSELYGHYSTILVTMPLILWIAFRGATPRVCLAFTLVSISALIITLQFVADLNDSSWLAVQLYLTIVLVCGYILHVVQLDRLRFLRELRLERNLLEQRVKERTSELHREVEMRAAISEKLRIASEKAQAASRTKSEFLANMSHEIRTPLNGVIGALQLLEETDLDTKQQELVKISGSCGKGLLNIINDILDLSKIEAGKLKIAQTPLNIRSHASEVIEGLKAAVRNDQVEIALKSAPDFPETIIADGVHIRQILYNLVGNALKFTKKGSIMVSIALDPTVGAGMDTELILQVKDTGIGISADRMKDLFTPFTQACENTSEAIKGTGLGLCIVQRLTQLMGGNVIMQSAEGKGTTVTVRTKTHIPLQQIDASASSLMTDSHESDIVPPLRILLAEDNKVNRYIIQKYLTARGHTVVTAENGVQVLERLAESVFDCIFMDIQMPVMDGVEATKAIRNHNQGAFKPDIPIVAMTAYATTSDRDRFVVAGMDNYITKPVDFKVVFQALATIAATISKTTANK